MSSLYGNFRNRKFSDIWKTASEFLTDYKGSGVYIATNCITDANAQALFYLLYSEYGNSVISSSDENQFRYQIFATIFEYGPAWEKELDIQNKLRSLTEDDIKLGSKTIYNHAFNPSTAPATGSLTELDFINEQNTTNYKKSPVEGYAQLVTLLKTDVTKNFINHFKKYFLQIVIPEKPLWYISEEGENDD